METVFNAIRKTGVRRGPDRIAGGICGALALRFGWPVWNVRIITVILLLLPFVSVLLYALIWSLTPWVDGVIPAERLWNSLRGPSTPDGPPPVPPAGPGAA